MILAALLQSDRYAALHPLFPRAFDYIRNTDLFAHRATDNPEFALSKT